MSILSEVLNWISNSFLLPVIVLLLAGMLMALVELGSFCSSYLLLLKQRRQQMYLFNLHILVGCCQALCALNRVNGFLCKILCIHSISLLIIQLNV